MRAPRTARRSPTLFRRSFGTLTFLPTLHTPEEDRAYFGEVVAEQEVWVWDEDGPRRSASPRSTRRCSTTSTSRPTRTARGIGSALFAHAQARRPEGFRLWVFQQNESARRFYERRGLRRRRARPDGSRNEERAPDALYEWRP